MWTIISTALFGVLIGLGFGMIQFPQYETVLFHTLTVTAGLFIFTFTNAILQKK